MNFVRYGCMLQPYYLYVTIEDEEMILIYLLKKMQLLVTGLPAKLCHVNVMSCMFAGTGTVKCKAYSLTKPSRT